MSDKPEEPEYFTRRPLGEKEMQSKLGEIRRTVGEKMNTWANRVQISMAFVPKVARREGERWEEKGKTWTIKDGVKQSISTLASARMPHWCPRCSKPMNHRFDRKFFFLRGWCFDCNVTVEHEMRLDGTWDAFEKAMVRANEKARIKDEIQERIEYIKTFTVPQLHYSDGRWETLAEVEQFNELFGGLENDVELMVKRLEFLTQLEQDEANGEPTLGKDESSSNAASESCVE